MRRAAANKTQTKRYRQGIFNTFPIAFETQSGLYCFTDWSSRKQYGLFNYNELEKALTDLLFLKLYNEVRNLRLSMVQTDYEPPSHPSVVTKVGRLDWHNLTVRPLHIEVSYNAENAIWTFGYGSNLCVSGFDPYEDMHSQLSKFVGHLYHNFMVQEGLVSD